MDFNNFYMSGNGNECPLQLSHSLIYFMCEVNITQLCHCHAHDIDELRQRLLHVQQGFKQSLTDDAVDQWPTHLHASLRTNGGHFEFEQTL